SGVFSFVGERKRPPIGDFIECDGVRLHYVGLGDPVAPSAFLFHGSGSVIQNRLIGGPALIGGLVDRLCARNTGRGRSCVSPPPSMAKSLRHCKLEFDDRASLKYALARTQSQKARHTRRQRRAFYLISASRGSVAKAGPRRRAKTTGVLPPGLTPLLRN